MPTIRFSIGTQSYTLSCEEGEEPHIRQLEQSVNRRFESMQRTFGSAGNQLVMAVTMLMMEEDIQKLQKGEKPSALPPETEAPASIDQKALREKIRAEVLDSISPQLEMLAETLENV